MQEYEYLPQLIVAFNNNTNGDLIHVKNAEKDKDYYCPCCGGIVKPRALVSEFKQPHYYHLTGECTKESQLHFFYKNWLFTDDSKFIVDDNLFEVEHIEIEETHPTKFGNYRPDITVYTKDGSTFYFEIFFSNRKKGNDYFCKWNDLGNPVVEINIKDYSAKALLTDIPTFKYLYKDEKCFSKEYGVNDFYLKTIQHKKDELCRKDVIDYKKRMYDLDDFWQTIQGRKSIEEIVSLISKMPYEDQVFCYDVIKNKTCTKPYKDEVREAINQGVFNNFLKTLDVYQDKYISFMMMFEKGYTYKFGWKLVINDEHFHYDKFIVSDSRSFSKKIISPTEIDETLYSEASLNIVRNTLDDLLRLKDEMLKFDFNYSYNNGDFICFYDDEKIEIKIECYYYCSNSYSYEELIKKIQNKAKKIKLYRKASEFFKSSDVCDFYDKLQKEYSEFNLEYCVEKNSYNEICLRFRYNGKTFDFNLEDEEDLNHVLDKCEQKLVDARNRNLYLDMALGKINMCKNNFWSAYIQNGIFYLDQKIFTPIYHKTESFFYLDYVQDEDSLKTRILHAMEETIDKMQRCGYRVMEEI